jgi:hypothetical protein
MVIKTHFFVEDRLVKLVDIIENYLSDNEIDENDIIKIDHSRFVNSNGDIITTIMLIYKKAQE